MRTLSNSVLNVCALNSAFAISAPPKLPAATRSSISLSKSVFMRSKSASDSRPVASSKSACSAKFCFGETLADFVSILFALAYHVRALALDHY